MSEGDWSKVRRVLAIRLDSMGDVLMTTPALRAIRTAPGIEHVTLLASPAGAGIARLTPDLDATIVYEAPWMKAGQAHDAGQDHALIAKLARGRFDAAVIFTVFSQTPFPAAMLAYLAGIPLILAHCRERAYRLVSHAVPETEPEQGIRHEARRMLDLVGQVGYRTDDERMRIDLPDAARAKAAALVPPGPWAIVHPGASAPSRRYPPELFAAVVRTLAQQHGWRIVLTGDPGERDLTAQIAREAGVAVNDLAGALSLAELAALIEVAPVVISNNTGPAHLAAAMSTPVVDLYALTNPQHTPWQVPHRVLSHDVECRWCFSSVCRTGHHLCLRGVPPEQVVAAALDLGGSVEMEVGGVEIGDAA